MPTGVIFTSPKVQFTSSAGAPLANGTVDTYLAGTTTPETTWQDSALSSANTNPIVLNSRGEATVWLDGAKSYKIVLKNAGGVEQYTVDNIQGASGLLTANQGSSLVNFTQSGSGAVVRSVQAKLREIVSMADFTTPQQALDAGTGMVFVPGGSTFDVGTALTVPAGVTVWGEDAYASVLRTTHASNTLAYLNASGVLRNVKLSSTVTRTGGFLVDIQGNGAVLDNCEFESYYIAVNVGTVGGTLIVGASLQDCEFRSPVVAAGSGAVQFMNFSNAEMRNCIITGPTSGTQPDFGIRYQNGDTALLTATNVTKHGQALLVDPGASSNTYALTISDSLFDSAGTVTGGTTVSSAKIEPAGGVYDTKISNTWFGLSASQSGCRVATSGAGVVDGITFTGCDFVDNGDAGLLCVGASVRNWSVTGGNSGGNTNYGIRAASATTHFTITGHRAGNIAGRGANGIGINVDAAASDNYSITGNNVYGNTTAGIFDGGTGVNATVTDNAGYNGIAAAAAVAVGASPWSYTAGHSQEVLYVSGGTISNISVDGVTVFGATEKTIVLAPNEAMSISWTVLPTVVRKRL